MEWDLPVANTEIIERLVGGLMFEEDWSFGALSLFLHINMNKLSVTKHDVSVSCNKYTLSLNC